MASNTTQGLRACAAVIAVALLFALSVAAPAQTVEVVRAGQTFEVRYTATLSEHALTFDRVLGYDTVTLPDADQLGEIGKPALPTQIVQIALPDGMAVTSVQLLGIETVDLAGEYLLLPAQPPRRLSDPRKTTDLVPPDSETYASSAVYPPNLVTFLHQTDLAGQSIAVLRICPVQYVPSEKKLTLATTIHIAIEGVNGYICGDSLPPNLSGDAERSCATQVAAMVVNPDDVVLRTAPLAAAGARGVAPGDYDYVIITPSNWVTAFQPLADWKTKKGMPATIVTTAWITANYAGASDVAKIRAFVQDAYATWGTTFFLLGGDTAYVPCNTRVFASVDPDAVPNDTYYADFDDDWVCEVHVGRASVTSTGSGNGGIAAFINKVLTYEKNPPLTNYAKKAGFFGFDLDASTHAETCKGNIRSMYVPIPWTVTTVYDSQAGNHTTNVIAAINAGQNLLNHADHSAPDYMGTGYVNHYWGLGNSNMDALTNGTRQSIFYSMGCDPAAFDYSACIAEHFVRNVNGGGLAFIGNSRYGWYNAGSMNSYSMRYDQYFFRSIFVASCYKLGTAHSDHKNYVFPSDDYYKYCFTELTLLGDPELPIWTEDPLALTVSHPASVYVGTTNSFQVQVSGGSGATVCLWKSGDVYMVAQTNASGVATFSVTPATTGTLAVTATKRNYLPYESTASVISMPNYVLTVTTNGQGSVALDPAGGTYAAGTTVQLTANAAGGWHFDHWSQDLTGSTNPTTIVMNSNHSVTAWFLQNQYMLTVNATGPGTIALDPPGGTYNSGTTVQMTANPTSGARFDHWIGDQTGSANPQTILMSGPKAVNAVFWWIGDTNCDGALNFSDINPFVLALSDAGVYADTYPQCPLANSDVYTDEVLDFRDINPFVELLSGQ